MEIEQEERARVYNSKNLPDVTQSNSILESEEEKVFDYGVNAEGHMIKRENSMRVVDQQSRCWGDGLVMLR